MSRIQRTLTIFTSLGTEFNYTLQATVPTHTLSKCAASLPRPNWEPVLYYSIVCVMGFILFCILVASYFEADRIFVADILKRKVKMSNGSPSYQKEKIFDLKMIGVPHMNGQSSPSSAPKIQLQPNLLNRIQRPMIEMTDTQIDHKSRESFITYLSGLFKSFFAKKAARKKVSSNIESPAPGNKSSTDSSATKDSNVTEKDKSLPSHDMIIPEKSNHVYSQHKLTLRKSKPVKRAQAENTANVDSQSTTGSSNYERKPGNKSNHTQMDKKMTDTPNTVKDLTYQVMTTQDSSGLPSYDDIKNIDRK